MKPGTPIAALMSALAGAGGAYFLDPRLGRRRRARARDVVDHTVHEASRGMRGALRDLEHRAHGLITSLREQNGPHAMGDAAIVARVRSRLGHVCVHPHAVAVVCRDGVVELTGPVLRDDVQDVLRVAWTTVGVRDVVDRLERHATADGVPGLSGASRRTRVKPGYWAPSKRLLVGSGAAVAIASGLAKGGVAGASAALIGTATLARALANVPFLGLVGLGEKPILDVTKATTINVPVEHVFAFFENPENFPKFMRHVEEVRPIGDARWHWKVAGVPGTHFEWDVVYDRVEPNRLLVWRSVEDAAVVQTLSARFEALAPNTTRLTIRLSYAPPGGILGHEVTRLLGADPKHELDEDMLRLKTLLEQGKTTGRAGVVTLEELRHRS
jgi:uncharacterized membrane protein